MTSQDTLQSAIVRQARYFDSPKMGSSRYSDTLLGMVTSVPHTGNINEDYISWPNEWVTVTEHIGIRILARVTHDLRRSTTATPYGKLGTHSSKIGFPVESPSGSHRIFRHRSPSISSGKVPKYVIRQSIFRSFFAFPPKIFSVSPAGIPIAMTPARFDRMKSSPSSAPNG